MQKERWKTIGHNSLKRNFQIPGAAGPCYYILKPEPPEGYYWSDGRLKRKRRSSKPPEVWTEIWTSCSTKEKQRLIDYWNAERKMRAEERQKAGKYEHVPKEKMEVYEKELKDATAKYTLPQSPCMPCLKAASPTSTVTTIRPHQENIAAAGVASEEYFALVHLPIPIGKAMKITAAKEALEKEWQKHIKSKSWLPDTVREKEEVKAEAQKAKRQLHFGALMELCHRRASS